MSISTIGLIPKLVHHEEIIDLIDSAYGTVYKLINFDDGSGLDHTRLFFNDGEHDRELTIISNAYPLPSDATDSEIDSKEYGTYLSLGAFGKSEEIIMNILRIFGGYIDANDIDNIPLSATYVTKRVTVSGEIFG